MLWSGVPKRFPIFTPMDRVLVPFSVLWCGFAIFWTINAVGMAGVGLFTLPGMLFIVIGLYLVVGRLIVRAVGLRRTHYVVTDQRVIIIGGFPRMRERSSYLSELSPPVVAVRADGTGSIEFGEQNLLAMFSNTGRRQNPWGEPFTLRGIEDPRSVRDIIATARAGR